MNGAAKGRIWLDSICGLAVVASMLCLALLWSGQTPIAFRVERAGAQGVKGSPYQAAGLDILTGRIAFETYMTRHPQKIEILKGVAAASIISEGFAGYPIMYDDADGPREQRLTAMAGIEL